MTREEVNNQVNAFFSRLGTANNFPADKNFVKVTVGEALIGFLYDESEAILKTQALIYRFRQSPNLMVIEALFAEQQNTDTGGGKLNFDSTDLTLLLEKSFVEQTADDDFYHQINELAKASLIWSSQILQQIAERIHSI